MPGSDYVASLQASGQSTAAVAPTTQNQPTITAADQSASSNPNQAVSDAQAADQGVQLQIPSEAMPYYLMMTLNTYTRTGWNSAGNFQATSSIVLPIPDNLQTGTSVEYEVRKIGAAGAATLALANGNASLSGLTNGGGQVAGRAGIAAADASGAQVAQQVALATQLTKGVAVNDYNVLMLMGPTLKSYSFRWSFSPKSLQESTDLQTFYKTINNAAAPTLGSGSQSLFFGYPQCAQLQFFGPNGALDSQLMAFKPAVITDMVWDFGPHGRPSFLTGSNAPETITVQISFRELEYWISGQY